MSELALREGGELGPADHAAYEAALADAKVDVARRAQLADEELVPLLRNRGDAWREWGRELGPAGDGWGNQLREAACASR